MHSISSATQGILFLGTPHQRDGNFSVGQIMAMAVRAERPDLDDEVVEVIKQDPIFELFNNTFQEYLEKREQPVHIVSFHEQRGLFRPVRRLDACQYPFYSLSPDCNKNLRFTSHPTTSRSAAGQP
jgi:hypothetical protein